MIICSKVRCDAAAPRQARLIAVDFTWYCEHFDNRKSYFELKTMKILKVPEFVRDVRLNASRVIPLISPSTWTSDSTTGFGTARIPGFK